MNKLFVAFALCVTLTVSALASDGAPFKSQHFFNNQGITQVPTPLYNTVQHYVWMTNGTTTFWNSTNVAYMDGQYNQRFSFTTNYTTPMFYGATNNLNQGAYVTNFLNNVYIGDPANISYYSTNFSYSSNGVMYASPFQDLPGWADLNADVGQGLISVTANSGYALQSNLVTFTFCKGNGSYFDNSAANSLVFALTCVGGTNNTLVTNLPSTFFTGAGRVRLWSVGIQSTNSTNVDIIGPVVLNGFVP